MTKPEWEISATTVYCDAVTDEVTLLVHADGTTRCTGRQKYARPDKETAQAMKQKGRRQAKVLHCLEDACPTVKRYHDSLLRS